MMLKFNFFPEIIPKTYITLLFSFAMTASKIWAGMEFFSSFPCTYLQIAADVALTGVNFDLTVFCDQYCFLVVSVFFVTLLH